MLSVRRKSTPELSRLTRRILRVLDLPKATVVAAFLPNSELRRLKRRFLNKKVAYVDVLAFPEPGHFPHPESKTRILGEVYLNADLRKRPKEMGPLLLHGILHLVGYRHEKKSDNIRMQRKAERIWAHISSLD